MSEKLDLIAPLLAKLNGSSVPADLGESVKARLTQLSSLTESPTFLPELDRMNRYVDWITSLPWNKKTDDILDLTHAKEAFEKNHYGLNELKERMYEYMSVLKLKGQSGGNIARAPILCFVGLVGTGKTTFAKSIAEALGRKFARIPFGGMGDPLDLRGRSKVHAEAEPGKIIKALRTADCRNPVIRLDEIDRVTDEGRASIMGVLVELLDPEQNHAFVDHYIDYPIDLSEALFVATANNTTNIATAVMDRLEPLSMPSYNDEEKITIGKKYMLPKSLKEVGISEDVITIDDEVWGDIVRPLGFDGGIRTLGRNIDGMVRKVARMIVEGKGDKFQINRGNVKDYLPQW